MLVFQINSRELADLFMLCWFTLRISLGQWNGAERMQQSRSSGAIEMQKHMAGERRFWTAGVD